ncbi:hypothetical protein TcasGA2_TC034165 [Tribolium castaneum]|uniref:Uncharacterized protein n=1 Tax=Tribolium castaneum TaxID=7070 RepID=A0A139WCW9_TRICA|nr:hypothetical protein TcasGA2_TC034165 [Tribolium castaneum]
MIVRPSFSGLEYRQFFLGYSERTVKQMYIPLVPNCLNFAQLTLVAFRIDLYEESKKRFALTMTKVCSLSSCNCFVFLDVDRLGYRVSHSMARRL